MFCFIFIAFYSHNFFLHCASWNLSVKKILSQTVKNEVRLSREHVQNTLMGIYKGWKEK
jgi:hypothetical protein